MLAALGIYGYRWDYCAAASGFPGGKSGGCVSIAFLKSRGRFLRSVNIRKICHEYSLFHFRNSMCRVVELTRWYRWEWKDEWLIWPVTSWKLKRNKCYIYSASLFFFLILFRCFFSFLRIHAKYRRFKTTCLSLRLEEIKSRDTIASKSFKLIYSTNDRIIPSFTRKI